ncbi:MAG: hypothetical protein JXQ27_07360 [Acidobacteria bacterium]|nr:hypothetical protein [Acidobacteriota bacterium]
MKRTVFFMLLVGVLLIGLLFGAKFYEKKPYTNWKEKEAFKMLEDSPWTYEFSIGTIGNIGANVGGPGGTVQDNDVFTGARSEREYVIYVRVSLFSSRPIRQAYAVIAAKGDQAKLERFVDFATRPIEDEIIISWQIDSKPRGVSALMELNAQLNELTLPDLQNEAFLATNTGKKVFIKDYIRPTPDGTGAKFVFPRTLEDGSPLLTPGDKTLRFQLAKKLKMGENVTGVDATFKLEDLVFDGQLEY